MRKSIISFSGSVCLSALLIGLAAPAGAQDETQINTLAVLEDKFAGFVSPAKEVMWDVAEVPTGSVGQSAINVDLNGVEISIPTDASNPLSIESKDAGLIAIELPFSGDAARAEVISRGVVAFDNRNGSITAPIVKNDGSVQIITVLESAAAPTLYPYQLVLPRGAEIVKSGDSLLIVNRGKLVGGLAPAWAKDATGRKVPTRYVVSGTTITQIIDHVGGQFKYPIVADPWIGVSLFSSVSVDTYRSQPRVNLDLSLWGWAVYVGGTPAGFAAGQIILNTAGWDEAWGYGGAIRSALDKPSQRQQFSCHALGAIAAGTWNLEKFRPNRTNGDWGLGLAVHRCNWETANRF